MGNSVMTGEVNFAMKNYELMLYMSYFWKNVSWIESEWNYLILQHSPKNQFANYQLNCSS